MGWPDFELHLLSHLWFFGSARPGYGVALAASEPIIHLRPCGKELVQLVPQHPSGAAVREFQTGGNYARSCRACSMIFSICRKHAGKYVYDRVGASSLQSEGIPVVETCSARTTRSGSLSQPPRRAWLLSRIRSANRTTRRFANPQWTCRLNPKQSVLDSSTLRMCKSSSYPFYVSLSRDLPSVTFLCSDRLRSWRRL